MLYLFVSVQIIFVCRMNNTDDTGPPNKRPKFDPSPHKAGVTNSNPHNTGVTNSKLSSCF